MNKINVLVVVDMQNDFISGALGTPEAQAIVPLVETKIRNQPDENYILFTQDTHYDNYLTTNEGKHLPIKHCIYQSNGWDIPDNLTAPFAELGLTPRTIEKNTFGSVDLVEEIATICQIENIESKDMTIELCGLVSDICVISNAMTLKTYFPEANIRVDKKCCAGTCLPNHEAALRVMESCHIDIV